MLMHEQGNTDRRWRPNHQAQLLELKALCLEHPLWNNPLLQACEAGVLSRQDFQYLFSQYYLYSKNFSRLVAAVMVHCDNDYLRSKLAENLWEESGELDLGKRHAEIFRHFLTQHLQLSLEHIEFDEATQRFVQQYMALCVDSPALESAAVLSLGTEGIVSTLYAVFKKGLLAAGLTDSDLIFFNIHIACDDAHAATLEEIVLSYAHERHWFERCKAAMLQALDARHQFFLHIHQTLLLRRVQPLIESTAYAPRTSPTLAHVHHLVSHIDAADPLLYSHQDRAAHIDFSVQRVPFSGDVLDPRVVVINPGCRNEYHAHAHETVILILAGEGEMIIDGKSTTVTPGSIVYVPRWLSHQTRNSGESELKFFAVTDYGLTGRFPINTEQSYRAQKEGVHGA